MSYDDDALDLALAALPLEEPPADFHARVMAATVYRPEPAARPWEVWLLGTFVALAAWVAWIVAATPHAGERIVATLSDAVQTAGLSSDYVVLWLAIGVSAAWWLSTITVPSSPGRVEAK
ncbi:MAG: hypothetical protein JO083_01110 [Candidatus Eremiobacteraeota bacterium]|nr:hypothetical protein [Candidatus Eremiobacteraeota bacterium]MBV8370002.1 hypothetical protein [Candidatus Eremiobacteraeota bacterium]